MYDNITLAISVIPNITTGLHKIFCNKIACNIWDFCITQKLWIYAAYLLDISNKEADKQSRILGNVTYSQLNPELVK